MATKGEKKHSVLFDVGPEEDVWERNVNRLRPNLSSIEVIQLSHWHRDHSGQFYISMAYSPPCVVITVVDIDKQVDFYEQSK